MIPNATDGSIGEGISNAPELVRHAFLQTDADAVLIFALLLFIILVTPYIFKKIKIPHIIGLIFFGWLLGGNHPLKLIEKESIELYSKVGLLFIMFIAGLEIDIVDFKKNSHKSLIFGAFTFLIPMTLGILSSVYILRFSILPAVLLASFYASHTLLTYPIISKYGISKNRSVNIAVGGTMITDVLALLVLAVVIAMFKAQKGGSTLGSEFWLLMILGLTTFAFVVTYVFPKLARLFLKWEKNNIAQYLFILGMVFISGYIAEKVGQVEAIIGAFLAGLALNPLIPETSPLKNRIEFIGNALFIPLFLIGVGMLISVGGIFKDLTTFGTVILIALTMITFASLSKFIAAFLAHKAFKFTKDEMFVLFGLSNSQAAATLAAVMVAQRTIITVDAKYLNGVMVEASKQLNIFGENLLTNPDAPIMNAVLNGTILMILATCTIASFATEKGAKKIAEEHKEVEEVEPAFTERILIPVSHPDTLEDLVNFGLTIKDKKYKDNIYAVNIISSHSINPEQEKKSKELLEKASKIVSATDQKLHQILRYDINISNGIYNVVKENKITDIIVGLHHKQGLTDTFLGQLTEGLLANCVANTYIYHSVQPVNTVNRMIVVIPENAEKEAGFNDFIKKICNLAQNNSTKFVVFTSQTINDIFLFIKSKQAIEFELINFTDWEDFLIVSSKLDPNSGLMIFMSRQGSISRNNEMGKISKYLNKYFTKHNYILYYPVQG